MLRWLSGKIPKEEAPIKTAKALESDGPRTNAGFTNYVLSG